MSLRMAYRRCPHGWPTVGAPPDGPRQGPTDDLLKDQDMDKSFRSPLRGAAVSPVGCFMSGFLAPWAP